MGFCVPTFVCPRVRVHVCVCVCMCVYLRVYLCVSVVLCCPFESSGIRGFRLAIGQRVLSARTRARNVVIFQISLWFRVLCGRSMNAPNFPWGLTSVCVLAISRIASR